MTSPFPSSEIVAIRNAKCDMRRVKPSLNRAGVGVLNSEFRIPNWVAGRWTDA